MVNRHLYIEGGGDSKTQLTLCRKTFRKLIENAGFIKNMPRLTASGSHTDTFDDFKTKHKQSRSDDYIAMLIDSEDPLDDIEKTWKHLKKRDNWDQPAGTTDDQVLFMTTCMETWIVADRDALKSHYVKGFQESALPPLDNLENRHRHDVQDKLSHATRDCSNAYAKGKRSFEVLAILDFEPLMKLPSFARMVRILKEKL